MNREQLRATFGTLPEQYERARPRYPAGLFGDLRALASGTRLLEIGCGTGQATRDLVEHGFDVTCVELSPELASLTRRNVPEATVVVGDAEVLAPGRFDVVAAFTAFHWLAPETRFATAARLLCDGGLLAVVETHHVLGDDPFFVEVQEDYDAVVPDPDNGPPPLPDAIEAMSFDDELFEPATTRRYLTEIEYTADTYIDVSGTYSSNIALPAAQREELFRRLHTRAAARGTIRKLYLFTLTTAARRQG